jgi:hypothetical protein
MSFLRSNFSYDLSPGEPEDDPVLHFLFTSFKGHCEHFASAMVMMLRTLGIPARMVGGYLGGEWNDLGQFYLVRQSDAHTWVEVWIQDNGWVPFDPTPEALMSKESSLKSQIVRLAEFIRFKWSYWVVNYNLERQLDLGRMTMAFFQGLGSGDLKDRLHLELKDLTKLIPLILLGGLVVLFWFVRTRKTWKPKTLGERMAVLFRRYGFPMREGETLLEFALRLKKTHAPLGRPLISLVQDYYVLEYGKGRSIEDLHGKLNSLKQQLKAYKRQ